MPWAQYSSYFTDKFWSDHVYEGDQEQAKKDAERIYQRRDVSVSSVLELDMHAIRCLVAEVNKRQSEYAAAEPRALFTSEGSYSYWERKSKRAKRRGPSQFRYAVKQDSGEKQFKIHHFDGIDE